MIGPLFAYLPNVVAAVLLVVVGSAVGQFAGDTLRARRRSPASIPARSLGSIVSGVILFVVGIMAIGQLRIDTDMVRIFTICTLSGLALAFGLSFGLGTRDITRNAMAGFYARKVFGPATHRDPRRTWRGEGDRRHADADRAQRRAPVHSENSVSLDEIVRR